MPRVVNPNAVANSLPGRIAAVKATTADIKGKARNAFNNLLVGAGGLVVQGVTTLTGGITGGLAVTGAIAASTTITAGTDLDAGGNANVTGNLNLTGAGYFPQAYNNPVTTGTYYAAYLNGGDSRLGRTASSQRYKQDISTMPPAMQAILALRVVQFRWKAEVEAGRDQGYDFGVIAEELHELGLTPWVFYNDDGIPEGVHYERLFLAALPVIQDHENRLSALEAKTSRE